MTNVPLSNEAVAVPAGPVVYTLAQRELVRFFRQRNRVIEYPVIAPGKLGPMRVFAELPAMKGDQISNQPDGMALDEDGNLYVAHYGMGEVQVLDPKGKLIRQLPGGCLTTSNVAFAGADMSTLYITGAIGEEKTTPGVLTRLILPGVKGVRILPPRK